MGERGDTASGNVFALAAVIAFAAILVYLPAMGAGFIWDDSTYLTENPLVTQPAGLWRAWTTARSWDYYPVLFNAFWLEYRIWGDDPMGYHVVNILLHAVNAILLWLFLKRLGVPGAWFAGLLFAVHPVNVASVAWISEQKNTLSMLFCLLACLMYFKEGGAHRACNYLLALAFFVLALLSKSAVVMLPVVLLLCAVWKEGRIRSREILRSVPFVVVALAVGLVTLWFQEHRAIGDVVVRTDGLLGRALTATRAIWFYLYKAVLPFNLSMIYPRWSTSFSPLVLVDVVALVVVVVLLASPLYPRGRSILVGLGCYVAMLFPLLGFFDVAFFRYSLVADHWQYHALPAVLALAAAAAVTWKNDSEVRRSPQEEEGGGKAGAMVPRVVLVAIAVIFAGMTLSYARTFRDREALWRHTLDANPRAWVVEYNLGTVLLERGVAGPALNHFRRAVELNPRHAESWNNLGTALNRLGRTKEAMVPFANAIAIDPTYAQAHNNMGNAYVRQGRVVRAIFHYLEALRINPTYADVHNNLANARLQRGEVDEAVIHYRTALRFEPENAVTHYNLGAALLQQGNTEEAEKSFTEALRLNPDLKPARAQLSLMREGKKE